MRISKKIVILLILILSPLPAFGVTIDYAYDPAGRLTDLAYDNGITVNYTYDAAGNETLKTVTIPSNLDTDGDRIPDLSDLFPFDPNRAPTLNPIGDKSVEEGKNLNFVISATDPDGPPPITYKALNLPTGAAFDPATRTFDWTPTLFQFGSYEVTFEADDGYETGRETITITVVDRVLAGDPDSSFGGGGKVMTDVSGGHDFLYDVALQGDGKIVAGGAVKSADATVVRYLPDGSLDQGFGNGGKVIIDINGKRDVIRGLAIQGDGKIVAVGIAGSVAGDDILVLRFNPDGTLDQGFGDKGILTTNLGSGADYGTAVAIQGDGKIVVAGSTVKGGSDDFAVVRYNPDGSLDESFDGDGVVTTDVVPAASRDSANGVLIQGDGQGNEKILAVGSALFGHDLTGSHSDVAIVRYNADGSLDQGFGKKGKVTIDLGDDGYGRGGVAQSDGKVAVAGYLFNGQDHDFLLIRLNPDGTPDQGFGDKGSVVLDRGGEDYLYDVVLQSDGKLVGGGFSFNGKDNDFALIRLDGGGMLDAAFGNGGLVLTDLVGRHESIYGLAIQKDGQGNEKIIGAGTASNGSNIDFALVRYLNP